MPKPGTNRESMGCSGIADTMELCLHYVGRQRQHPPQKRRRTKHRPQHKQYQSRNSETMENRQNGTRNPSPSTVLSPTSTTTQQEPTIQARIDLTNAKARTRKEKSLTSITDNKQKHWKKGETTIEPTFQVHTQQWRKAPLHKYMNHIWRYNALLHFGLLTEPEESE